MWASVTFALVTQLQAEAKRVPLGCLYGIVPRSREHWIDRLGKERAKSTRLRSDCANVSAVAGSCDMICFLICVRTSWASRYIPLIHCGCCRIMWLCVAVVAAGWLMFCAWVEQTILIKKQKQALNKMLSMLSLVFSRWTNPLRLLWIYVHLLRSFLLMIPLLLMPISGFSLD